jgi:hypothetical protein
MALAESVLVPMPLHVAPAKNARSTVILASASSMRAIGRWDDYVAALPEAHRDVIVGAVAGTWIPCEIAAHHYAACDAVGLSPDAVAANGRRTFDAVGGMLFGAILRMAKTAGVTPWTFIEQLPRFWLRSYDGGGIEIVKVGPKEARIRVIAVTLLDSPYFRNALRGLLGAVMERFCTKAYVHEPHLTRPPGTVHLRVQWA